MNIEDLEYLEQTFEFINDCTELIDHDREFETYANFMMNCKNIIQDEIDKKQTNKNIF